MNRFGENKLVEQATKKAVLRVLGTLGILVLFGAFFVLLLNWTNTVNDVNASCIAVQQEVNNLFEQMNLSQQIQTFCFGTGIEFGVALLWIVWGVLLIVFVASQITYFVED